MPSDDPVHRRVMLYLNGRMCLRCRAVENGRPTEVVLPSSKLTGEPVLINTNRTYVERALKLGFAELLLQTPAKERFGVVFPLLRDRRRQYGSATVGRVVSEIGEKAGIIVNAGKEKYASAHDLRRSFGTRWAAKVKPATLQLLMRHESVETTMKYYVDQDADDVADLLWAQHQQSVAAANQAATR